MSDIPVYYASISADGCIGMALVDEPAVDINFELFSKGSKFEQFRVVDEERRLVVGCMIRVGYPIMRVDSFGRPYYLVFDAECAQGLLEGFLVNNHQNEVNLGHSGIMPEGIIPVSFYIKDSLFGIRDDYFPEVGRGSIFCVYHIVNDDVWASCKAGVFRGFSIEAYLDMVPVGSDSDDSDDSSDWVGVVIDSVV